MLVLLCVEYSNSSPAEFTATICPAILAVGCDNDAYPLLFSIVIVSDELLVVILIPSPATNVNVSVEPLLLHHFDLILLLSQMNFHLMQLHSDSNYYHPTLKHHLYLAMRFDTLLYLINY